MCTSPAQTHIVCLVPLGTACPLRTLTVCVTCCALQPVQRLQQVRADDSSCGVRNVSNAVCEHLPAANDGELRVAVQVLAVARLHIAVGAVSVLSGCALGVGWGLLAAARCNRLCGRDCGSRNVWVGRVRLRCHAWSTKGQTLSGHWVGLAHEHD